MKASRLLAQAAVLLASSYGSLFLADVAMFHLDRHSRNATADLRGMFTSDEHDGYRLTPGFAGIYDDGFVRVGYRINSEGFRDDEPNTDPRKRHVLIIGDSFAFGSGIPQENTIDKAIERLTSGNIDAYNLGVGGYGPPQVFSTFRRQPYRDETDVVYVFFGNDLRFDNLLPDLGITVFDGYLVPKRDPAGRLYSEAMYKEKVRLALLPSAASTLPIRDALALKYLRAKLAIRERFRRHDPVDSHNVPERELLAGKEYMFSTELVDKAIGYVDDMQREAEARRMRFHVLIVPFKNEVRYGRYSGPTSQFIGTLRQQRVHVIEDLRAWDYNSHFLAHDLHLNSAGAQKAAEMIVNALD